MAVVSEAIKYLKTPIAHSPFSSIEQLESWTTAFMRFCNISKFEKSNISAALRYNTLLAAMKDFVTA